MIFKNGIIWLAICQSTAKRNKNMLLTNDFKSASISNRINEFDK